MAKFAQNSNLGIAAGQVYEVYEYTDGKADKLMTTSWSTAAAVKGWRKKCLQEIGPLLDKRTIEWDVIDNYKAMMLGWDTRTFEDEELEVLHLKPMVPSVKNFYRHLIEGGRLMYFRGTYPLWVLASASNYCLKYPYVVGGLFIIMGYLEGVLEGEQYDDENFRRWLWKWQKNKLLQYLRLH